MKNRRERERERNIPYTRADPYTYQNQKILMAAFITPSPMRSILTWICGVFLFSFSVVEQFVCTEKMDLQKSAAVVFFSFAFKHWVFCFVLVKFTDA